MRFAHVTDSLQPSKTRTSGVWCAGSSPEPVPAEIRLSDFYTSFSYYVKGTRTAGHRIPTVVMQPPADHGVFSLSSATAAAAADGFLSIRDMCESKYGKAGHLLVGKPVLYLLPRWGQRVASLCAGMVARLTSTKSPGMFLRAAAIIASQMPNVKFVLAGGETHAGFRLTMEWLASHVGLTSEVRCL